MHLMRDRSAEMLPGLEMLAIVSETCSGCVLQLLKLSTAQAWGYFSNGGAIHITHLAPTPTLSYPHREMGPFLDKGRRHDSGSALLGRDKLLDYSRPRVE